jgi:gpW
MSIVVLPPGVMTLNGLPIATLQQWLTDSQLALAQLSAGARYASVSYEGKSVTYMQLDFGRLTNWIMLLQRQLASLGALSNWPGYSRRAIRPYFR